MKKWEDGKNAYGLFMNGTEVGTLYNDPQFGFYFTAFLDYEIRDIYCHANTLIEAKIETEKQLVELYKGHIESLANEIKEFAMRIQLLNETKEVADGTGT